MSQKSSSRYSGSKNLIGAKHSYQILTINGTQIRWIFLKLPYIYWSNAMAIFLWFSKVPSTWFNFLLTKELPWFTLYISDANWNHVPSSLNTVDCLFRCIITEELINKPLWWHRPSLFTWISKKLENLFFPEILETQSNKYLCVSSKNKNAFKNQPEVQMRNKLSHHLHINLQRKHLFGQNRFEFLSIVFLMH